MSALQQQDDGVCGAGHLFPQTALRDPAEVMRLDRMGSFFPSRLSFMRALIRDLADAGATCNRTVFELDQHGFGRAVYAVDIGDRTYSLCAFATPLDPTERTDRVIAEAWDSSFVLFDGVPTASDLDRLHASAPRQEAARYNSHDLVLSRANRSVRLFEHVVDRLASGQQPDGGLIGKIGYLMRTTAVYGNGKFGIADRDLIQDRPVLGGAFRAEMLAVWLIRTFTHDLVDHMAYQRSPSSAVGLDRRLKRHLGIGNATGLGMAPFLVSHPELLNNWMLARETALARVRAIRVAEPGDVERFRSLLDRAALHLNQWNVDQERQQSRIVTLRNELEEVKELTSGGFLASGEPWDRLMAVADRWSLEGVELLVSTLIETYPTLVDGLADCMTATEHRRVDAGMTVDALASLIAKQWSWATELDYEDPANCRRFWYTSEDKLEPRIGDRFSEAGAERERPLDVARRVAVLAADLDDHDPHSKVAEVLLERPEHRYAVQRVQTLQRYPYSEIRDNLIGEDCLPIDMLRCKLSFFGASKFDPKSDLWTRVTLFQGAPLTDELTAPDVDDWWLPAL
ncbi:MAG: hypothetical protein HKN24_05865 [Acidimicrobiales bacterium]|nr:hypothetical protein [Acidimicrobiales bacterium]